MRAILYIGIALVSFLGVLAGAMFATNSLNAEALSRLMGSAPEPEKPAAKPDESLGTLARQLNDRAKELDQREQQLKTEQAEFDRRKTELMQLEARIEERLTEIKSAISDNDTEQQARRQTTANTLERMDPKKAAERIEGLPPEEAADILRLVKDKQRAKIVEQLKPDDAVRILRLLQEPEV